MILPAAGILEPGERHWETLTNLLEEGQVAGPLLTDAALAALAIEHGAILHTTDRDFSRFLYPNPRGQRGRTPKSRLDQLLQTLLYSANHRTRMRWSRRNPKPPES